MTREEPSGPLDTLTLEEAMLAEMIAQARAEAPQECCGLIAFRDERAVKLYPGTNTERSATRYNMDLREVAAALGELEQQGWWLGAIYHSHPRTAAVPSQTDLRHAYYPDALMVIISLAVDPPDVRAYRVDGPARQVPIVIVPNGGEVGAG